ncbi:MAG: tRNA (adenosine(37)-N6)-dimethylallyltransferase MiaA [Bacteroidota bacterium]
MSILLAILGPTATGKTALAAHLACELGGEVISADSRQVYRGMDIGSGKDLWDYQVGDYQVPYHLIDIADPGYEYNIFEYQRDFLAVYRDIAARDKVPVLCGGSGMYLDAILRGYRLAGAATGEACPADLQEKSFGQLVDLLRSYKTPHNITDFEDRPRLVKAIMVARASATGDSADKDQPVSAGGSPDQPFPKIDSIIFGISYPRELLKIRISARLEDRLANGMVGEVEALLQQGISPGRLMKYGLEYRYVTLFVTGRMSHPEMSERLNIAIRQFAKRQMTWFRHMERRGMKINWIDGLLPTEKRAELVRIILNRLAG